MVAYVNTGFVGDTIPCESGFKDTALAGLYLVGLGPDGFPPRRISSNGAEPMFSPNGQELAFIDSRIPGVMVFSLGDSVFTPLERINPALFPAWAADGSGLYYNRAALYPQDDTLFQLSLPDSVVQFVGRLLIASPSADGRRVVGRDLSVLELATGELVRPFRETFRVGPTGSRVWWCGPSAVAFGANHPYSADSSGVYFADLAGDSIPHLVYARAFDPSCSAEGRWIAMSVRRLEDRWSADYGRIRVIDRVTGREYWPTR